MVFVLIVAALFGLSGINPVRVFAGGPSDGSVSDPADFKHECETVLVPQALSMWEHTAPIHIECEYNPNQLTIPDLGQVLANVVNIGPNNWMIIFYPVFETYSYVGKIHAVIHEVGHCLLIPHSNDRGSIMYPWVADDLSQTITAQDRLNHEIRWNRNRFRLQYKVHVTGLTSSEKRIP